MEAVLPFMEAVLPFMEVLTRTCTATPRPQAPPATRPRWPPDIERETPFQLTSTTQATTFSSTICTRSV
eukprot:3230329-Rhodomonas_salina.1